MKRMDMSRIGEALGEKRKNLNLTQQEIADDFISAGMISNIENGKLMRITPKVQYLANKIGFDLDRMTEIEAADSKSKRLDLVFHQLKRCEVLLNQQVSNHTIVFKILNMLNLKEDSRYYPYLLLLKGKGYRKKGVISKSIYYLNKCIQLCPEKDFLNVRSTAYGDLAMCHYLNNDIKKAISTVRQGMESFVSNGERSYLIYNLQVDEIIYLEKMGLLTKALPMIAALFEQKEKMDMEPRLNLFEVYGRILLESMPDTAIDVLLEGLDLSMKNGSPERNVDLSIQLARAYKSLGNIPLAKNYCQLALELKDQLYVKALIVDAYIELGIIEMHEGDREEAEELFLEGLKISKKCNDMIRVFDAYFAIGCLMDGHNQTKAIINFEYALDTALQLKMDNLIEKVIVPLMNCLRKQGNDERVLELIDTLVNLKNKEEAVNGEIYH